MDAEALRQAWLDARSAVGRHQALMTSKQVDRPKYGTPGFDEYQQRVMVPLIAERDRLRAAEKEAKAAMNKNREAAP